MADEVEIREEGLEPIAPFVSPGGLFELDRLDAVANYLRVWARDAAQPPAARIGLRVAVASLQAVPPTQRLDRQALLEQASRFFMRGELVLLADRATGQVSILGGPGTPAEVKEAESEFVPYEPVAAAPRQATTWVGIELVDDEDVPYAAEAYRIELPDGSTRQGELDKEGKARIENIPEGKCKVIFPGLDATESSGGASAPGMATGWIGIELVDHEDVPYAGQAYRIELPDGSIRQGKLDKEGKVRIENIPEGECKFFLADLHATESSGGAATPAAESTAATAATARDEAAPGDEAAGCFFELALPLIPALDEGDEYPSAGGTLTLRSSGGYERALAVSEGARQEGLCCFVFDDIPAERHNDDFSATLTWDSGEFTLFEGAKIGHFMAASDEAGPRTPVFAAVPSLAEAPEEESAGGDAEPEGGDDDDAPNGFELPLRYLADLFKE